MTLVGHNSDYRSTHVLGLTIKGLHGGCWDRCSQSTSLKVDIDRIFVARLRCAVIAPRLGACVTVLAEDDKGLR